MPDEKILVLMGGTSKEREVSLKSGAAVLNALRKLGYIAEALDVQSLSIPFVIDLFVLDFKPDLAFIAMHGKGGEDGCIQGFLEVLGVPYTFSGVASSAIGINKILTKKILVSEGIPTAPFEAITRDQFVSGQIQLQNLVDLFGLPMVIKAATQGSSIGTYIVNDREAVMQTIEQAFNYDYEVLVEKYITGTEVTSTVIGNSTTEVLPLIEITAANEFYDFQSKYTPGMCTHIIPARVPEELQQNIAKLSERVYKSLGCRGCARIDYIIDQAGNPYVLEINTVPGMTEMSLVPDAARAAGMNFEQLIEKLVRLGLEKR